MKWAIKKGTAFLTMFALLVMMLTPTMSIADNSSGGNGQENTGTDIKLTVTGSPANVSIGSLVTFTYFITNNDDEDNYTGITLVQGNGQNITNHVLTSVVAPKSTSGGSITISGTVTYTVTAADTHNDGFWFKFNTVGTLGNKDNKKSEEYIVSLGAITPGTITVTKSYSDQSTGPQVPVQLLIDNGSGFVASGSPQTTVGLTTTFNVPDISKPYKVEEATVPAGYTVSYPGGQNVVFVGTAATVSILNTLDPTPPPPPTPGTITVTKAYSNEATGPQVPVQLFIDNGSGFVASGSPQTTVGLTTVFNVPDITKTYKVEESTVPSGFTVSYPGVNGQNVVFVGTAATVSILNTLDPTPPPPPTPGTITVTKMYSDESTGPQVAVRLLINNGSGFVPAERPHMTVGLTTTFTVPDISKPYKVEEAIVPAGYTVSYPGGQNVVFSGTPATASISILNTLIPTPPPPTPGTITVTKAYSDQSTGPQVSVRLLINNGEGFEAVGSPQFTIGLTTSFNVPDITKTYKVEEAVVPAGYTVSYPGANGQNVVFVGTAATVSILNTLNPTPPPPPTPGTITVTKVYSDQKTTPEVSVQLFINSGEGFVASGSPQTTVGLTTVFNVPDITKTYKVEEAAVPAGYTVSYPGVNGQNVVFVGTAATVSILNTLNPTPPPPPTPGTITVTKAYSNQSTSPQVSVRLLINNGEGFEVVGSPQSTIGLTTSFNVPDISKTYKIEEVNVPSGYTVSYPGANGQNVVFTGTTASVSILNTLIPIIVVTETEDQPDIDTPAAVLAAFSAPDPAPPIVVVEEPIAATAPVIVTVPEEAIPESAPVTVVDEDVPLAAPALPKTGELPGFLFYGLGTMISGLGIYLRRKSS